MNILHNYIKLLSNNFEYGATSQSRALARFDLERSKLWRRLQMYDMFFAFTFRALFFILSSKCNAPHRVVFNSYSTASRSSSHLLLLKGLFFGHAFFYFSCILLLLLLFLLLLFCRRQNSYLLFQCLDECQQEGVSTAFFPYFSISFSRAQSQKLNFQFGTVFFPSSPLF